MSTLASTATVVMSYDHMTMPRVATNTSHEIPAPYHGGDKMPDSRLSNSVLAESNVSLDGRNAFFGRGEIVEKTGDDLAVSPADARFTVAELTLGYVREVASVLGGSLGIGAAGTVNFTPGSLEQAYGTRTPLAASIFLRIRPGRMHMGIPSMKRTPAPTMPSMSNMP